MKIRYLVCACLISSCSTFASAIDAPSGKAVLTISGNISQQGKVLIFDEAQLDRLPQAEIRTKTPWYKGEHVFSGPLLKDVLALAGSKGKVLHVKAINDYAIQIPASDANLGAILARKLDGKKLTIRDKGPLFLIYPFDAKPELHVETYYSRSVWQLKSIQVE